MSLGARRGTLAAGLAVGVVLFALAFAAAPKSCEGGLEVYLAAGVLALIALFAIPFFMLAGSLPAMRFAWACAYLLGGAAVWLAGFAAADVKFMCRLF